MKYLKEYKFSNDLESSLRDALVEISDDREIELNFFELTKYGSGGRKPSGKKRICLDIVIDDLFDVTDNNIVYTTESREKITKTWEEIFRLLEIFKSALERCNIEYKTINFEQGSDDVDNDGDPIYFPLRLRIITDI